MVRQLEVMRGQSGLQPPVSSWLRIVVLLILSLALAACGARESITQTSISAESSGPASSSAPELSSTPTASPSPFTTPTAALDSIVQNHPDGSISLVDREHDYSITFPPGWIIFQMAEVDLDEMVSTTVEDSPEVQDLIDELQDTVDSVILASQGFRFYAFNTDPDFAASEFSTIVNVLISERSSKSLDLVLRSNVQIVPQVLTAAEILSSEVITNSKNVPIGIMSYKFGTTNDVDLRAGTFVKVAMFHVEEKLVTVTGSSSDAFRAELEPVFDTIFDNIELVGS